MFDESAGIYYPVGADCVLYHAYWDGTAIDHSSYGNDGTVFGAIFGALGLTFDGNDDYISIPADSSLNWEAGGDYSRFYWVNFHVNTVQRIDSLLDSDGHGLYGTVESAVQIQTAFYNGAYPYTQVYNGFNPLGGWQLIGFEVDSDVGAAISINGVLVTGWAGVISAEGSIAFRMRIGEGGSGWETVRIHADIGDAHWFKSILTNAQRMTLYNATKARYGL